MVFVNVGILPANHRRGFRSSDMTYILLKRQDGRTHATIPAGMFRVTIAATDLK
jgi:hypothetical protein